MKRELENKIFDAFPKVYTSRSFSRGHYNMAFGFECKDGWFELISEFSKEMNEYLQGLKAAEQRAYQVVSVREREGVFYFEVTNTSDKIEELRLKYKNLSATVCEECGRPGEIRKIIDFKTILCQDCFVRVKETTRYKETPTLAEKMAEVKLT